MTAQPAATAFADWLEFENRVEERHELVDGRIVMVQGGTELHDTVVAALYDRLVGPFRSARCRVFAHNRKVAAANGDGYYPDVVVRCGPRTDEQYDASPTWVFEVLSPSNRTDSMLRKYLGYTRIDTLAGYVVVDPVSQLAVAHVRRGGDWHSLDVTAATLPVGPVLLDFAELFASVDADMALGE